MYYHTKSDVDKHVENCLRSVNSDTERNLRCFSFAKLYFNVGDYEQARRYLSSYLSVKPASAEGQSLLGKILEKLGKTEAALGAYRSSLEIDPSQNNLVLKVCELLASDDVNLDRSGARYFCEKAQSLDPHNPAVFSLKERILTTESNDPDDVTKLLLKELETRPTDVKLRIRLLKHLLQNNQLKEAYSHAASIEEKNFSIFLNNLSWYETLTDVLIKYQSNYSYYLSQNTSWEFWMLLISSLDRLVGLSLDEHSDNIKSTSEYVNIVFNFDQTLSSALDNINTCSDRQLVQEFTNHYTGQLCYHLITLIYKQAKKDIFKFKDALNYSLPLLFAAYHAQPPDLQSLWLSHSTENRRLQVQRWHKEAAFRCSQTGHILLSIAKDRKSTIIEKAVQCSSGLWREQLFKNLFVKRDQKAKMKSSYFASCTQLIDITIRLPELNAVYKCDEEAQLVHPDSLHHFIWIGLNHKLSKFNCTAFKGLQYSIKNLNNCAAETLNILDIESFIFCATLCSKSHIEDLKHRIYYNMDAPSVLPVTVTDHLGTLNQAKWLTAAYRMYKNESSTDLGDVRLTLIKGIEVVRCAGYHGLDVKLLIMLANIFAERAKHFTKQSEIDFNEARAELYWKAAIPLLEKLRNNQAISYSSNRLFEYKSKEMTTTEIHNHLENGRLFSAVQLMKKKEHEKALKIFETLKDPYASFYQAQIYKLMAEEQTNQSKENVTSEMRSQNIILLSLARDCLYLTLDRIKEPSVDRKHPLNNQLGTEIDKIERLLSRIDPDCTNRNECDGMSDENMSSTGSTGDHYIPSYSLPHTSYLNGSVTPRRDSHNASTPYRLEPTLRREARPSPERLDAQLRQLAASKDTAISHIADQYKTMVESHRNLLDEIRGFREGIVGLTAAIDDLKIVKHTAEDIESIKKSVDDLKTAVEDLQNFRNVTDMFYEMKKEISELKKDPNKVKNSQLSEEDLYVLDEEYGADYNINTNVAGFNAALYPNYQNRLAGNNSLAYGAPALYPSMYPMAYHYAGLGLPQAGALPFGPDQQLAADFRTIGQLPQGLNQPQTQANYPQTALNQASLNPNALAAHGLTQNTLGQLGLINTQALNQTANLLKDGNIPLPISTTHVFPTVSSQTFPSTASYLGNNASINKAPPVNVVITTSDPLPTTKTTVSQPVLSVTIPPQHLKGSQQPKTTKPHNYQIQLPSSNLSTVVSTPSVLKQSPMVVSTQSLLSNIAPPVYSALADKNVNKNSALGFQIEKSLSQSFNNTTSSDKANLNKSNKSASFTDEHDPCPDYKPVIPLPDEVPINTGEEEELTLFCERAKLYRFVNKEWRERGIGILKILSNPKTGKVRLLMRRDQVHKICANHFITPDLMLTPMESNDKAYIWAANDFADQAMVLEKLCVKFKTNDEALKFYNAFEDAKKKVKKSGDTPIKINVNKETPKTVSQAPVSLGGFVFTSTPTFKPKEDVEVAQKETLKTSPFAGFTFSIKSTTQTTPLFNTSKIEFKPVQKLSDLTTPIKSPPNLNDSHHEEFVPTAEFKPVIPLPEVVTIKTGEENAEVLFESKAKLLRFDQDSKEWKERGIGIMKILKEASTIRLLMRRDQVHKVCCNHQLLKNMVFEKIVKSPKAITWYAQDYSEEMLKPELFAIRFKTEELTEQFKKALTSAQDSLNENNVIEIPQNEKKSERNEHARIKPNPVEENEVKEVKLDTKSLMDKFKPRLGSWECRNCYIINDGKDSHCAACETAKNDTVSHKSNSSGLSFSFSTSTSGDSGNLFEVKTAENTSGFNFNNKPVNMGWGDAFKPKENTWECQQCYIPNNGDKLFCVACETPKNGESPKKETKGISLETPGMKFNFGIPSKPDSGDVPKTKPSDAVDVKQPVSGFGDAFKMKEGTWECKHCYIRNDNSKTQCISCNGSKDDDTSNNKESNKGINLDTFGQKFNFGVPTTNKINTGSTQSSATFNFGFNRNLSSQEFESEEDKNNFIFGSPQKHSFEFTPRSPRRQSSGPGDEESDDYVEEECDNIYFKPVIPLPDEVAVKTGEEEEEVLYCHRAKLFRFVHGEWKERGIGDIKILRKPDTKKLRVVMRREQVLKICLNHILTKDIEYIAKDEKTWLFTAPDFSEGEINHQQFCLRFKSAEVAQNFKISVDNAFDKTSIKEAKPETKEVDDSDVEIISETKVTPEEEQEALKLGLPPKFFAYRQLPDCTCDQCKKDDEILAPLFKNEVQSKSNTFTFDTSAMRQSNTVSSSLDSNSPIKVTGPLFGTSNINFKFNFNSPTVSQNITTTATTTSTNTSLKDLLSKPSIIPNKNENVTSKNELFGKTDSQFVFGTSPSQFSSPSLVSAVSKSTVSTPSSVFGEITTPSNIFNTPFLFTNKQNTPTLTTTNTIFGSSANIFTSPAITSASKIFGSVSTGNIFSSPTTKPNIFNSSSAGNLFAVSSASTTTDSNIFGGGIAKSVTTGCLFGTTTTPTTSSNTIFGGNAKQTGSIFGNSIFNSDENKSISGPNIFGNTIATTTPNSNLFQTQSEQKNEPSVPKNDEIVLKCDTSLSFASLAAKTPDTLAFGKTTEGGDNNPFAFLGAGTPVFGSANKSNTHSKKTNKDVTAEEGNDEEYDPHYEPIISLPATIVVSTGEEDETALFNERAKLYRYDSNEWKERGVGQMKLLYHPVNNTYRLLLRREQVHKIVLNQLIIPDLNLQPLSTSDKAWMWGGHNFVEEEVALEKLAARFKTPELAKRFYEAVQTAITSVKESQENKSLPSTIQHFGIENVSESSSSEQQVEEEQDDDDEDDDIEDERNIMFTKRCTLSEQTASNKWKDVAMGDIQIYYDPEIYGARISMNDDTGLIISNTLIAINTEMDLQNNECTWRSIEWADDSMSWRNLKATFSSEAAANEFYVSYQEGVSYAQQSDIVDEIPTGHSEETDE